MIYLDLILNLTLLIALTIVSDFIEKRWNRHSQPGQILQGVLFGAAAVFGMLKPFNLAPGLIFDGRSIMVSLCGLFFGIVSGTIAAVLPILCRISFGGSGAVTGSIVIVSSLLIGVIVHYRVKPHLTPPRSLFLYLFGVAVHVAMLALMFTLPGGAGSEVFFKIAMPVLLLYPLATILAGKLLSDQIITAKTLVDLQVTTENLSNTLKSVQESEIMFKDLFHRHSAVKIIVNPADKCIVDANKAATDYYGWSQEQLLKMKMTDINTLPVDEINKVLEKIAASQKSNLEMKHRRADGSIRDVEVFSSIIEVKGQKLLHNIVHDITEKKQAELQQIRLLSAIEQAGEIILITDEQGHIEYVNPAFEKITGYTKDEVLGKNPDMFRAGLLPEEFYKNMWNTINAGKIFQGRLINKNKKGEHYTVDTTISPVFGENGKITNFVGIQHDVTSYLKLEEQYFQSQKLESIGRLAGGVAHDYNNMLSVIIGNVEIALSKIQPSNPLKSELNEILAAARRSTEITKQLLAFARKQTISPVIIDVNTAVESILKMLRHLIGENIELSWHPTEHLPPIKIDTTQFEQVLANLCINARDAISDTGKVTIETQALNIAADDDRNSHGLLPGTFVMMAVSDNGCGMDAETRKNVFEPFFTTKSKEQGTGLGLATVFGIVKQNNGFINVYSEPGKGSTFKIYLPAASGKVEKIPVEKKPPAAARSSGETILLVEDEQTIREISKKMLEMLGYKVIAAESPVEALKISKNRDNKLDLLMTDVVMPGMNGRQLADKIRSFFPQLKVLFMSGYTANVIVDNGVLKEGMEFIQKPFSINGLSEKIRSILAPAASAAKSD